MASDELELMRKRLTRERSPGGRVSGALRREVLAVVERARRAGESYREVAKELGVSFHTMMGWRQRARALAGEGRCLR